MKKITVSQAFPLMQHLAQVGGINMASHPLKEGQMFRMNNRQLRELLARTQSTMLSAEPIANHLFGCAAGTDNGELQIRRVALNSIKNN